MAPKFLYFDLGKVLVDFDVQRMYRQVAEVAGIEPDEVREALRKNGLHKEHELGRVSSEAFCEAFCEATGVRADCQTLIRAASDIFELNVPIIPLVGYLHREGYRMGVLSNTCQGHWEHCLRRFRILAEYFPVRALSSEIHAAKPDEAVFQAAAELAGVPAGEIFFTDDLPENVAGARAAGFDAVQFTSVRELAAQLRSRGLRFNY